MPDDTPVCPLAELCAEAERLAVLRARIEAQGTAAEGRARRVAERAVDEIAVTLTHIAQRASDLRPASRRGALFALACAAAEAEAIEVADEPPAGAMRRLRRHLWALRAHLEASGAPLEAAPPLPDAVGDYVMPRHRDPHALVQSASAAAAAA